jgi:DNA-binding transcriptional regulator YbjK
MQSGSPTPSRPAAQPHSPLSADRRRTAILESTLRLIAKGGIDSVTHRAVAADAGVSLSSTTYHFANREDMILEAFRWKLRRSPQRETTEEVARPRNAAEAIEAIVDWTRRQLESPENLLAEYELLLYAARDRRLSEDLDAAHRLDESMIAAAMEKLGAPRPLDAATTLLAVMRAFEVEYLTRPRVRLEDLRRRLEVLVPALLSGTP